MGDVTLCSEFHCAFLLFPDYSQGIRSGQDAMFVINKGQIWVTEECVASIRWNPAYVHHHISLPT